MSEFLILNSFVFWFLLSLFSLIIARFVKESNFIYSSIWSILFILIFTLCGPLKSFFKYAYENPINFILILLSYGLVGVLWSFFKWSRFVKIVGEEYSEKVAYLLKEYKLSSVDEIQEVKGSGNEYYSSSYYKYGQIKTSCKNKLNLQSNEDKIWTWVVFWVFSILYDVLSFLFHDLFIFTFKLTKSVYVKITSYILRKQHVNLD